MVLRTPSEGSLPLQCDVVQAKGSLALQKGPQSKSLSKLTGELVMKNTSSSMPAAPRIRGAPNEGGEEEDDEERQKGADMGSMLRKAVRQMRAGMIKRSSTVERAEAKSLRPTLESFQCERVDQQDLSKTSVSFFGGQYFKDDWFPTWLTDRKDFLTYCPRYCPDHNTFDQIADHIPRSYMVVRAMKKCKWGDNMDMPQIRHLARKARVMEFPRGTTIFRQGDVADALYIVVKGSVSLRIKQQQERRLSQDRGCQKDPKQQGVNAAKDSMNVKDVKGTSHSKGRAPSGPGSPIPPSSPKSGHELEVAVAKEADVFGEVGLESVSAKTGESRKRAASAYCQEATIVARIPAEAYKVELKAIQSESTRRLCEWFESGACSLINHLSRHGQIMLAKKVQPQTFTPDSTIYKEGDKAHAIFLVRRGHCVAKKTLDFRQQIRSDVHGIESKGLKFSQDADLIEFKEGDYFGEEFLVDREERAMRVVATRGGAELIVVLNAVADELFKVEALPAVLERWNDVMSKVRQNKNECLGNIQSQQLRRDVRLDCFGPAYQRRAHIKSASVMDTVQQLLEEDSQRQVKLKRAYEKCIGQIDVQEVSVKELKRREEGGKRRQQVMRREKEDAEERRNSLLPNKAFTDPQDAFSGVVQQKEVVWLRKERRKLQNASEKESIDEKEELHEEICDDVRSHIEKSAVENNSHFRHCMQALDKQVAHRNAKAELERKKQKAELAESSEESDNFDQEEEIPDEPVAEEPEYDEGHNINEASSDS
eukprot:gnl/MRDRNA2_/MRDRNA2_32633_c0_seq1.p1 gnl/MRDRNA2_/MRDRNA2_32633_c0~~gnl/MRDRNA2_/MRDRNA2_32633_c0_seq1.p1  ORF type:complete len:766 (+),score=181.83 gnl/MRDRNA2_/MRDRNA2_32633_c0_seq1:142-2439(+)